MRTVRTDALASSHARACDAHRSTGLQTNILDGQTLTWPPGRFVCCCMYGSRTSPGTCTSLRNVAGRQKMSLCVSDPYEAQQGDPMARSPQILTDNLDIFSFSSSLTVSLLCRMQLHSRLPLPDLRAHGFPQNSLLPRWFPSWKSLLKPSV